MRKITYLLLILICLSSCKQKKSTIFNKSQATVYYNGDIITMAGDEPVYTEALVVRNGKIEFTGNSIEAMEHS